MTTSKSKIIYTKTDEAPALATYSLLPIIRRFASAADIDVELSDISLAARILSTFGEFLPEDQKVADALTHLGQLTQEADTNIIKLPNISASIPQLKEAIKELQKKGFSIPDYPESANSEEEQKIKDLYGKVLGSAVNPVLREGNSDRRAPTAVKNYAKAHPHSMGQWSQASRTHVAHMRKGDFYSSEKSLTVPKAGHVRIEFTDKNGQITVLKPRVDLLENEVIDGMFMSKKALCDFYVEQIQDAKDTNILFSLHVKATMMKSFSPDCFWSLCKSFL